MAFKLEEFLKNLQKKNPMLLYKNKISIKGMKGKEENFFPLYILRIKKNI